VAQLLALAIQVKRPKADDRSTVSLMRYTIVSVVTPPERMLHDTGLWFRSVWNGYVDLIHVRRDNAALKEQIQRLRLEQASIAPATAIPARLRNCFFILIVASTFSARVSESFPVPPGVGSRMRSER